MGSGNGVPGTAYLPVGRTAPAELGDEIRNAARSPIVDALLRGDGRGLAVLDAHRQIVAVNAAWLALADVDEPAEALGLRPGESLGCAHAKEGEDGCGTGPACASCGAAIATLVASHRGHVCERECFLATRTKAGEPVERDLRVRAAPMEIEGSPFLLLSAIDVTAERRRDAAGRAFMHDLANTVSGLRGVVDALGDWSTHGAAAEDLRLLADELVREVRVQRLLAEEHRPVARGKLEAVELAELVDTLRRIVRYHPAAQGKELEVSVDAPRGASVRTDPTLVRHVVVNMLVNALEATRPGRVVRLEASGGAAVAFRVWNEGAIPSAVVPRIFQRYFTTKGEPGRGQGTFAMKLFGEKHLGGVVAFSTTPRSGTWFELRLPRDGAET